MRTPMKLTQSLVRELVRYDPQRGLLIWKTRGRSRFNSDAAWRRWNKRYAGGLAFTYIAKGYRWGSVFNKNYLAHRVVWLHVYGEWPPHSIAFKDRDGTNLKLNNLIGLVPIRAPRVRFAAKRPHRERLPFGLAA